MSWQDELRAALEAEMVPLEMRSDDVLFNRGLEAAVDILDRFAAAHPGLVEVVPCGECSRLDSSGFCGKWERWAERGDYCSDGERPTP